MWPCLFPGDLLRFSTIESKDARPGDIVVISDRSTGRQLAHRLVRVVRPSASTPILLTAGDRSSCLDELRPLPARMQVARSVLRRGKWLTPSRKRVPFCGKIPYSLVRLSTFLAKPLLGVRNYSVLL